MPWPRSLLLRPMVHLSTLALPLLSLLPPTHSLPPLPTLHSPHTSSLDPERYASLDLTHVEFDSTDPLAQILGLITLSPIFLLCAYLTLVIHRRELLFFNAFVGQVTCEWINGWLKAIFKQERPTDRFGQGYGMPSSHSQFVGFFAAFFLSHFIAHWPSRVRWIRSSSSSKTSTSVSRRGSKRNGDAFAKLVQTDRVTPIYVIKSVEHLVACAAIVVVTVLTAYSRYHLMYHSFAQIVVGLTLGTIFGLLWYHFTERLSRRSVLISLRAQANGKKLSRTPIRRMILDHPISIALRVRDSYSVFTDGGIEAEYGTWREGWMARRSQGEDGILQDEDDDGKETRRNRMYRALALANKCEPTDTAFCVGCVICPTPGALDHLSRHLGSKKKGISKGSIASMLRYTSRRELGTTSIDEELKLFVTGFSRELPGNTHAEECALLKVLELEKRQRELGILVEEEEEGKGREKVRLELDLYTTMEPCSERLSKKKACVRNIVEFNAERHRILLAPCDDDDDSTTTTRTDERNRKEGNRKGSGSRRRKSVKVGGGGGGGRGRGGGVVVELRIKRVLQGTKEPEDFVKCQGTTTLRSEGGIQVISVEDPEDEDEDEGVGCGDAADGEVESFKRGAGSEETTSSATETKGLIEREAMRLAKKGHKDRPFLRDERDERTWRRFVD